MDAQILQGEIEAVQEAILAVDAKVDELEEEAIAEDSPDPEPSAPIEPVIDLAQTVGRLEAEISECRTQIAELRSSMSVPVVMPLPEPELEPEEVTVEEVEVPEEPQPESEDAPREARNPNWLEKILLIQ